MKKNLFVTALILTAVFFSSCKKDKPETTAHKVQHKWTYVSSVENDHDATGDNITTTPGDSGDYIMFNSNGTVTSFMDNQTDTSTYSVISDTQIAIDNELYTIKILSSNQLVLYVKEITSTTEYSELTINLKR
jgi:PBP1b-binding outer membrane lipoprotein LpoB